MPYKVTIQVEVISDKPIEEVLELSDLAYQMMEGDLSGTWEVKECKELSRRDTALLLEQQGSDPGFILGEDGWKYALHCGDEVLINNERVGIGSIEFSQLKGFEDCVTIYGDDGEKYNVSLEEIS